MTARCGRTDSHAAHAYPRPSGEGAEWHGRSAFCAGNRDIVPTRAAHRDDCRCAECEPVVRSPFDVPAVRVMPGEPSLVPASAAGRVSRAMRPEDRRR